MRTALFRRFLLLAGVFIILLFPGAGRGTTTRFQAFDIWPRVAERRFFSLDSTKTLYKYQYHFQLSNMFIWAPLDLLDPTGIRLRSVVSYGMGHFISAGFGITDSWQVGMTLPFFSAVKFEDPLVDPSPGPGTGWKVGDLRMSSKIRVIDPDRYRFGLAFEPFLTVPLGGDAVYMGEASVTGGVHAIGEAIAAKRVRIALNLGAEFHGERVLINNINFSHRWLSSLGVSVDAGHNLTFSVEAHANSAFNDFFANKDTIPVEFLGGVQWDIGNTGVTLGAGGGTCAICGARGAKARGFLNVSYRRITDEYLMKDQKALDMMYVTLGLKEGEDIPYAIYDLVEKCPIDRSRFVTDRDDPKCMEIYELQDLAASCPPEESYRKGKDNPKCLKVYALRRRDSDGDGVPDYLDRCPTQYGAEKDHGCPSGAYLIIHPEAGQIITKSIHFDFNRANIRPESEIILETLTGAIHAQPAIMKLSIEGHTDNIGSDARNMALSQARARAVYRYLVDHGINPQRLSYKGYGQRYPVADNTTPEGRARNRRVNFIIEKVGKY